MSIVNLGPVHLTDRIICRSIYHIDIVLGLNIELDIAEDKQPIATLQWMCTKSPKW